MSCVGKEKDGQLHGPAVSHLVVRALVQGHLRRRRTRPALVMPLLGPFLQMQFRKGPVARPPWPVLRATGQDRGTVQILTSLLGLRLALIIGLDPRHTREVLVLGARCRALLLCQ